MTVTFPVLVLLLLMLVVFLMGIREAVAYLRWMAHLKRARTDYASRESLSGRSQPT
jgi:hypothetical protein